MTMTQPEIEQTLNSFDRSMRSHALETLLADQPQPPSAWSEVANMHCHTFFSFNAYGYSPTGLAWLARQRGWKLMGLIDFDVLDGVDEFLQACDAAAVRASCGIETRVFFPEFATREVNSPGEPGVMYHIGLGFTSSTPPAAAAPMLAELRRRARDRNIAVMTRVNAHLAPVQVDYDRDVLPLTPAGNATERHMVEAYIHAAERSVADSVAFWADRLNMARSDVEKVLANPASYRNTVRSKLMKQGGVGYVQPDSGSFPGLEPVTQFIEQCGALPCHGWLDGLSDGEQALGELLETLVANRVVIANIVPDRNWNIANPEQRKLKVQKLYEYVDACQQLDLPLNVGTEMNSPGNKLIDDFDATELAPVRSAFLDGAYFIYGHTVMQRVLGMGYQSEWANAALPTRRERNDFYTEVGRSVPAGKPGHHRLAVITNTMDPGDILSQIV
jgi:hypothetical protein